MKGSHWRILCITESLRTDMRWLDKMRPNKSLQWPRRENPMPGAERLAVKIQRLDFETSSTVVMRRKRGSRKISGTSQAVKGL